MRTLTAIATGLLAVTLSTAAEAKRSRGDEIAKLRAQIAEMKRDLLAMQRKVNAPPLSFAVTSLLYPPEGIGRLSPPVAVVPPPTPAEQPRTLTTYVNHLPGVDTSMLPVPLREWLDKVRVQCAGFRVISAYRPGARVAGSGRVSLHALKKAADFVVKDYSCAQKVLAKFPGGLSTDPHRVNHLHISYWPKSREWAARFAHGGGKRYYAKRWKARYAARHRNRG